MNKNKYYTYFTNKYPKIYKKFRFQWVPYSFFYIIWNPYNSISKTKYNYYIYNIFMMLINSIINIPNRYNYYQISTFPINFPFILILIEFNGKRKAPNEELIKKQPINQPNQIIYKKQVLRPFKILQNMYMLLCSLYFCINKTKLVIFIIKPTKTMLKNLFIHNKTKCVR